MKKIYSLIILDGFGISTSKNGNAVYDSKTPYLKKVSDSYIGALVKASGNEVGLAFGEMGNSEVGHLNIGSGRIMYQDLINIDKDIEFGHFKSRNIWSDIVSHCGNNKSDIHLIGLTSSGGIHSSVDHVNPIVESLVLKGWTGKIYFHFITDGQDVPPNTARVYYDKIFTKKEHSSTLILSSVLGRFYALDKSENWERTKTAYDCLVKDNGAKNNSFEQIIEESYKNGLDDERIYPSILSGGKRISDNDAVIFFDFRPDRARQLTRAFMEDNFSGFNDRKKLNNLFFATMTDYGLNVNCHAIIEKSQIKNTLAETLAENDLTQFHIAETEKYAHVTYFFNGGKEEKIRNETRVIIPSPKVNSYAEKPEMSAFEITAKVLEDIDNDPKDFYVINFANADMVGHTGDLKACAKAIEVVDDCVEKIISKILESGGVAFITADHGNAEEMLNEATGKVDKEHSIYPVPFWIVGEKYTSPQIDTYPRSYDMTEGLLSDIAPTILDVMNIKKPETMTGQSILRYMRKCPLPKKSD